MIKNKPSIHPLLFPIFFFGIAIFSGALLLLADGFVTGDRISIINAIFTATSATCVTGLTVVDTGTAFSRFGQGVILFLIQIGGLGVMTLASLGLYLIRQRVSLTDRLAVGQNLLHDPGFSLGRFLISIVLLTLFIETIGARLLYTALSGTISPFSAIFHAVSAFCNAGFSLNADSLVRWKGMWGVNSIFMALIIVGGIGFSVLVESLQWLWSRLPWKIKRNRPRFSWYSRVVLSTSFALVFGGALVLFFTEHI